MNQVITTLLELIGLALIVAGIALISVPVSLIVAGIGLIAVSYLMVRNGRGAP